MGLMQVVLQSPSQKQTWESTSSINKGPQALLSMGFVCWVFLSFLCVWWDSLLGTARRRRASTGWTTCPTCHTGPMLSCAKGLFADQRFGANSFSSCIIYQTSQTQQWANHIRFWCRSTGVHRRETCY